MPKTTELRENLAAVAHIMWSGWMQYMFGKCEWPNDGTAVIPAHLVARWQRQKDTPYRRLSPQEQESDREQADKMLAVFGPVNVSSMPALLAAARMALAEHEEPGAHYWDPNGVSACDVCDALRDAIEQATAGLTCVRADGCADDRLPDADVECGAAAAQLGR